MLERLRIQPIAGEDRHVLAERHMAGGAPAPERVVIHRGQVVVDQRVGVDQLERRRQRHRVLALQPHRVRGREREHRPDALASGQQRVAHRLLQARGERRLGEAHLLQVALYFLAQLLGIGGVQTSALAGGPVSEQRVLARGGLGDLRPRLALEFAARLRGKRGAVLDHRGGGVG